MKSKHFELHEFFPRDLYNLLISQVPAEIMWRMVNPKLVTLADKLKERFPKGTMYINNWKWNKEREWSGLRTPDSRWYRHTSQHTLFNALDAVFSHYSPEEVRKYILANPSLYEELGGMELGGSWLHVDVRDRVDGKIVTFYP